MSNTQGLQLLITDASGVYIPQRFAEGFDLSLFGIAEDDADIALLSCTEPGGEWYWEAWDAILDKAKTAEGGYLYQDGDLWLVHPQHMDEQEYINFFGENPSDVRVGSQYLVSELGDKQVYTVKSIEEGLVELAYIEDGVEIEGGVIEYSLLTKAGGT
jgi:hypothetical protein